MAATIQIAIASSGLSSLAPCFPRIPLLSQSPSPSKPPSLSTSRTRHHHILCSTGLASQTLCLSLPQTLLSLEPLCVSSSLEDIDSLIDGLFYSLRQSVKYNDIELCRAVHGSVLKIEEDIHLRNALIGAYCKLGFVFDAYRVFKGLTCPNGVSYAAMMSGFAKSNCEAEAIELFFGMRSAGIEPDEYGFVAILTACIRVLDLELGWQLHGLIIKTGYLDAVFVANALMGMYGKCGCLDYVLKLFGEMRQRDIASWNTVISSVVKELLYDKAFELFRDMQRINGFRVDHFMVSTMLTACTGSNSSMEGREIHAHATRIGLDGNLSVNNALIVFYTKCGSINDVVTLFERMPVVDIITWTSMITSYMEFGLANLALETLERMPERNSISFNAVLAGLFHNGEGSTALRLFIKMVEKGVELTDSTLTSIVNACGLLMNKKISEQIHGFTIKFGSGENACIEAALLDMCTRCGRMPDAEKMFCRWPADENSSVIETSMLCGYARNGLPDQAVSLFLQSQSEGKMDVDEVSLTSVLGVSGTLGFREIGEQVHCQAFKSGFVSDLGVANSIVSMYSKCCDIDEAIKAFDTMLVHDIVSWNGLIAGHLLQRQGDEALAIWSKMEKAAIKPNALTLVLIISAYRHTSSNLVDRCRSLVRSMKTVYGIEPMSEHYSAFVRVLGHWGLLEEAEETINKMPFEPDSSVWRALLDSCRLQLNATMGKQVVKRILAMEPHDPSTYILVSNLYSASGRWHCSEMVREDMREKGLRKQPSRSWIIQENKVHSFYARDKSHPQMKDIYSGLDILILECMKSGYKPDSSFVLHEVEEYQKKDFLFYHSAKLATTYGLLMTKTGPIRIFKNILLCGDCHTFLKHVSLVTNREIVLRDTSGFHCFSNGQCSCKDYWC
ncbi:pentatricopeptide repeat-containing protein [Tripterygium wilfordii]|uniref:Pentatricopeptide repeat-containing protein n=1 Tax=Tripterygium wilfordii TaxID=458696 RepID=A0A7J7DP23_TRIWF|nr:pentatricopeptide repeat-containing protein At5g03800 [Tripterygium wilfordii]KAF5747846.1 pentatricopeptide repeat-containing protein [Tripterygium wilfordii]